MSVSVVLVKELRERTGAGMLDCKKALTETAGDMDAAIRLLRERGIAKAAKKAGRTAAEGRVEVLVTPEASCGVLVEINCETDFSAKNKDFVDFCERVAALALSQRTQTVAELLDARWSDGATVAETLASLIALVGENMSLRRLELMAAPSGGMVGGYSHLGGKIGTLVAVSGARGPKASELVSDVAMQVAAMAPRYLRPEDVPAEEMRAEKEIFATRLRDAGKPEMVIEKAMAGQEQKFVAEVCLTEQAFVKTGGGSSVQQVVSETCPGAQLQSFARFQLGEGIEVAKGDFAAEVAQQLGGHT